MEKVLEFPTKVFAQWGAIAQEIIPYLGQRGAKREEIYAVIDRLRIKWEQSELAPSGDATDVEISDTRETVALSGNLREHGTHVPRHWKSQSARTLIESAITDYERHTSC